MAPTVSPPIFTCFEIPIFVSKLVLNLFSTGDNDSEIDVYGNQYEGSIDSHMGGSTYSSYHQDIPGPRGSKDPYPAWTADRQVPISPEYVASSFLLVVAHIFFLLSTRVNLRRSPAQVFSGGLVPLPHLLLVMRLCQHEG